MSVDGVRAVGVGRSFGSVWIVARREPLLLAGLAYACAAAAIFPQDYFAILASTFLKFEPIALCATLAACSVIGIIRAPMAPLGFVTGYLADRLLVLVVCNLMFVTCLAAYTTVKINIPAIVPFYLDPWLSSFDQWLYGTEPWAALLLPYESLLSYVDLFYSRIWALAFSINYIAATLLLRGRPLRRYLWGVLLVYLLLGNVLAACLSSVGPIFYSDFFSPDRFAAARSAMFGNQDAGNILFYSRYLLLNYQSQDPAFGTGISAMPSIHVACAVLLAWILTGTGRTLALLGWIYAALIFACSVYTGWHYSLDGYVSIVLVSVMWLALSRYYRLPVLWTHNSQSKFSQLIVDR